MELMELHFLWNFWLYIQIRARALRPGVGASAGHSHPYKIINSIKDPSESFGSKFYGVGGVGVILYPSNNQLQTLKGIKP